ncbi:MAG TPA: PorV/PorQ family protein [Candidatus Goldiibacteriota bacterium]|nr:PorV/PorQ family protein [Candidatus Goldiibacteriota bacterium]HRQ44248.1 PorV/PorQ family protein [Candidatus Goldiibacteriota bacterium]
MFKKLLLFLSLFFLLSGTVFSDIAQIGTTSNNFLKIMAPAKPAAMGEAYVALADDVNAIQYNPAGMAKSMLSGISFTHIIWFQDIAFENLNLSLPFPMGTVGFSVNWMHFSDSMFKTEIDPASITGYSTKYEFSPYSFYGTVAYSKEFSRDFYIGASLKILNYAIDPNDDKGAALSFMADIGLIYDMEFLEGLSAGVSFKNLGPGTSFISETYLQPMNILAGVGYSHQYFSIEGGIEYYSDNNINYSVGANAVLFDVLNLRAGYKGGTVPRLSFGGGFEFSGLAIDYAFVPYTIDGLGYTHRATLTYNFGSPEVKLKAYPVVFSPNGDKVVDYTRLLPDVMSPSKVKSASITIQDAMGIDVRKTKINLRSKIFWNGKDTLGMPAAEGDYFVRLDVDYGKGIKSSSAPARVEIDLTPPSITVDGRPKLVKPGRLDTLVVPVSFDMSAFDKNGVGRWKLVIYGPEGQPFKTFTGSGDPMMVTWDGKDDLGINQVDTGKTYSYALFASDSVGNWGKSAVKQVKILFREVVINISSDTLFDLGKADVKIAVYSDIKKIADQIKGYQNPKIIVEGHTDNLQMKNGAYADNMELSKARAQAVVNFFVELFELDRNMFRVVGYGETKPVADNNTPEGRRDNRRVTIRISGVIFE